MGEINAPEAAGHRELGAVVLDYVGDAELVTEGGSAKITLAQPFVDVGGPEGLKRELQLRMVEPVSGEKIRLVARFGCARQDDLVQTIFVEQVEATAHEAHEAVGDGRQLLRHIAGMTITAA